MKLVVVILAAGEGTRMKSSLAKVLHPVCGEPLIYYPLRLAQSLNPEKLVVILGYQAEKVKEVLPANACWAIQEKPKGTADAIKSAQPLIEDFSSEILVMPGDAPLINLNTLKGFIMAHQKKKPAATILTCELSQPSGYGRVVYNSDGSVQRIVEERDALEETRKIKEVNSGVYLFKAGPLFEAVAEVKPLNVKKEYYLTDVIEILNKRNLRVNAFKINDEREILGVNSRQDLILANRLMRERICSYLMDGGVTILEPSLTFIGPETSVGEDTVIYPLTFLEGRTRIGKRCEVGPSVKITNSQIGDKVRIYWARVNEASIEDEVEIGPFAHIRPGTVIKKGAKVGTFVEMKKSELGEKSKVPHLSYIGDATIGKDVNVGAGTITCNFDGVEKHPTLIEEGAFIGSDTMLVAPVKIGKRAVTGAGSTITRDVPEDSLALERAEQIIIGDWKRRKRRKGGKKEVEKR